MMEHPDLLLILVRDHQRDLLRQALGDRLLALQARARRSPAGERPVHRRRLMPRFLAHHA
jgi:hypothetical protein